MFRAKSLTAQSDEGKPTCQRCERGGHECQGYPHPLRVVFDRSCAEVEPTSRSEGSTSRAAERGNDEEMLTVSRGTSSRPSTESLSVSRTSSRRLSTESLAISQNVSRRPSAESIGSVQEELTTRPMLREPNLSPFREEIYSSFLVKNLLVHVDIGKGAILGACERRSPMTDDSVQGAHNGSESLPKAAAARPSCEGERSSSSLIHIQIVP